MIKFDKKTDKIAMIAPASGCKNKSGRMDLKLSMERLQKTIQLYEENGFSCVYDEDIFTPNKLEYFAAPKGERLRQLQNAILDPDIKIIAAFRGGYGCTEIVFDCMEIEPATPKILIGFSDITALHFLFNQKYKFPTIHGAMSSDHSNMTEKLIEVIAGKGMSFNLKPINSVAKDNNQISGEVSGGNLSLISNMIGTKLQPDFKEKIIFVEDVNEKGYHIHRFLMHMKNAGLFIGAKAIIFADFTNSEDHIEETFLEFSKGHISEIPAFRTSGIGHGKINYPVVIGGQGKISNLKWNVESPFELV